jgi:hypothetical protein
LKETKTAADFRLAGDSPVETFAIWSASMPAVDSDIK